MPKSFIISLFSALLAAMMLPAGAQQQPDLCAMASQPATLGAGPTPVLINTTGEDFDQIYIRTMYQQHSDVAALASFGAGRAVSEDLQGFSRKIVNERNDMNRKLAMWYRQITGQPIPPADTARVAEIQQNLMTCNAPDFDRQYARTMISIMAQSRDAAGVGVQRLTRPEIRNQSNLVIKVNRNEMSAFQRWMNTGFLTAGDEQQYYCWNYGYCPYYGFYGYYGPYWW